MADKRSSEDKATAIFFAETRNRMEVDELANLANDLMARARVRLISEGVITAYAVRMPISDLPVLSCLEATLKRNFVFGHVETPLQETVVQVVEDLAEQTGSRLDRVPRCELCHAPVPFPPSVRVMGEDGKTHRSRSTYCHSCAASLAAPAGDRAPAAKTPVPVAA